MGNSSLILALVNSDWSFAAFCTEMYRDLLPLPEESPQHADLDEVVERLSRTLVRLALALQLHQRALHQHALHPD